MTNISMVKLNRQYVPWLISLAVIAVAAFVLFGFTGFRTILAIALLFIVPSLLLLKNTGLDAEEKIMFSLFIGLGMFPLLVFSINQLLPSFRVSAVAALVLTAIAAFLINLFRQKGFAAGLLWPGILQRVQKKQ